METQGQVQLYTGDGKGKTTAALGLAMRAWGAGLKVLIIHFMKNADSGEVKAFSLLGDRMTVEQYGSEEFYIRSHGNYIEHRGYAKKGYDRASTAVKSGYDLVICDEIINALTCDLLTSQEILDLIQNKGPGTELILTGRNAPENLYEHCSLVTEMKEIKHYYSQGIEARSGIEM
jgi:cob(I)alamin adenosyltransferase